MPQSKITAHATRRTTATPLDTLFTTITSSSSYAPVARTFTPLAQEERRAVSFSDIRAALETKHLPRCSA